jgi:hypothetical protein
VHGNWLRDPFIDVPVVMDDWHAVSTQPYVKLDTIDPESLRSPECCDRIAGSSVCDTTVGDDREIVGAARTIDAHGCRLK